MANMDIRTPKFFTDTINFLMSTGTAQNGNFDVVSGSNLINTYSAGSEAELFDMKPLNQVTFTTSTDTTVREDHVLININKQTSSFKTDYIAILNHNMNSAEAKVKVSSSDTLLHIQSADMGSATAISSVTEVVNADSISSNVITPATDGSTVFTFTANDDKYYGIQFEGSGSSDRFNSSTNLSIGCIMIGEHYTMPRSPELQVKRTIVFDGVDLQQSIGGQRYANSTNLGKRFVSTKNQSPFGLAEHASEVYGGRIVYEMNFNYLSNTDIIPTEYFKEFENDDTFVGDVWNRTKGNMIPFILSIDSTDTGGRAENSFMFSRFGQNSLDTTQVAPDVFNLSLRIEEEF